ncbi:MAG TPA: YihY/virulence factor BrkB family protein [Mycobacteriales bacterium]|nr:YihY/virulence factor BrkB family protein [Mycobacteriales bacterium]
MATIVDETERTLPARRRGVGVIWTVIATTVGRAWRDRVLGLAAEAGFWQLLSLPSMLLGIVGIIGFFSGSLGPDTIHDIEGAILRGAKHVIVPSAVDSTVKPALDRILAGGRADVVSISFVVSLWTGSSAMATYVNTITIAYGLRHHRNAVHSRILALVLYVAFVVAGVVLLPLLVLGPGLIVRLTPKNWHHAMHIIVSLGYWPVVVVITLSLLATLYHLSVPVRTPWRRALPGAVLGLVVWVAGSFVLRIWLTWAFRSTATYGPLSAPVAVLIFLYLTALAILLGAELNAEIDRLWPLRATAEARLEEEQAATSVSATT